MIVDGRFFLSYFNVSRRSLNLFQHVPKTSSDAGYHPARQTPVVVRSLAQKQIDCHGFQWEAPQEVLWVEAGF